MIFQSKRYSFQICGTEHSFARYASTKQTRCPSWI